MSQKHCVSESFVVEKILNKRINKKGEIQYQVKWKGYSDAHNTWEPAANFENPKLVNEYENEVKSNGDDKGKRVTFKEENHPIKKENYNTFEGKGNNQRKGKKSNAKDEEEDDNEEEEEDDDMKEDKGLLNKKRKRNTTSNHPKIKKEIIKENTTKSLKEKNCNYNSNHNPISPIRLNDGSLDDDIPLFIITAKQHSQRPTELLCEIEWKERNDGTKPNNSYFTNHQIKAQYPKLLVDYYEKHFLFPEKKNK